MVGAARTRACGVWVLATATALLAVSLVAPAALALRTGADDLETALVRGCSAVLLGCAAWAWAVTTAVVVEVVRGAPRSAPSGVVRRGVLALCGLAAVGGLVVPAAGAAAPGEPRDRTAGAAALDGLPLPDRAEGAAARPTPARPAPQTGASITVRPGDTLWAIARRDLGAGADGTAVARRVRALHDLNRRVIGPDPDLVHPGQQLRLPAPSPEGEHP
ncbi:LysM peptidoglycan-binding domain-containing protein [Nocardioides pantholopis]|uniref:LysM peptidoglycan-binding domain-containing protein n=1 Tax=Nocardioides pantholopis TaxID=2483798 RepID=UPI000FD9E8D2|nr:LysM peptidoglycan-binding domain-containing protein [Nocardioides pantholopis]